MPIATHSVTLFCRVTSQSPNTILGLGHGVVHGWPVLTKTGIVCIFFVGSASLFLFLFLFFGTDGILSF